MSPRNIFFVISGTLVLSLSLNIFSPNPVFSSNPLYQAVIISSISKETLEKENGIWWGLHNGGRPTFYFTHLMKDYPATFSLTLQGCETVEVINDGHRFESNNIIAKQSDVSGRGMALTTQPGKCYASRKAYIEYIVEDMPVENPPVLIP